METETLSHLLFRYGFEAVLAGLVVFLLLKYFLPGYLTQKGKNLATQEDIEDITKKVEHIKAGYAEVVEEVKSNNQIKIAAIEREKSIKKEVFMEAAEAITKALNMISNFPKLNMAVEALTADFASEAGKIAKVQIVGSGNTVKAVTTIMSAIGTEILNLMLDRSELLHRQKQIDSLGNLRSKSQGEVDRYISVMKNLNLQGNTDQDLWNTVNRSMDFENEQIERYDKDLVALWEIQSKEHLEYSQRCMDKFFVISALLPDVVLAVREELDLEISQDEYLDIYNKNLEVGKGVFKEFLNRVANA